MERIEKIIEVERPLREVYDRWTRFEDFPRFMAGVKSVRQIDDTHVRWRAEVWGKELEWDAEITEQDPDKRISWKSVSGAPSAGTVRFESLGPRRTLVRLAMAYDPSGLIENVGDALGFVDNQVQRSVEAFKQVVESEAHEPGWRGQVDDSHVVGK
jgi:uncharacterized membrane protein